MRLLYPTRRHFLALTAASTAAAFEAPASNARSFWLFKLLRPDCVLVRPTAFARLHCSDASRQWILEGDQALCLAKEAAPIRISGPDGASTLCALEIPGAIRRTFSGVFDFRCDAGYVCPVATMDCETATSCIVGAELPVSAAHFHALAAQAVVSRSVVLGTAAGQHAIADFCDTTHCQFLRSPAPRDSATARAIQTTSGYVLVDNGRILPARYSAACGGQTQAGFHNGHDYVSVSCEACRNKGTARRGHGWGLCQEGAMALAQRGCTWRAILCAYFPNSSIANFAGRRQGLT